MNLSIYGIKLMIAAYISADRCPFCSKSSNIPVRVDNHVPFARQTLGALASIVDWLTRMRK